MVSRGQIDVLRGEIRDSVKRLAAEDISKNYNALINALTDAMFLELTGSVRQIHKYEHRVMTDVEQQDIFDKVQTKFTALEA